MDLNSKKIIWKEWADGMKIADDSLNKFLESEKYGIKDLANFTKFLKEQNKGLTGFKATIKSLGKSLASFGLNLAIDAGIALIMSGVNELMSMETDAAERAQEMAEKAIEDLEKAKEQEEAITTSTKELVHLFEDSEWGAESAKRAGEIYNEMADRLEEVNGADNERVKAFRAEADQLRETADRLSGEAGLQKNVFCNSRNIFTCQCIDF